jgi:uncharacterized damage-inducible protein DinB
MPTILEAYLERLEALHAEIQQIIADLSPEALDWTPGPEMNSLGVLVAHVAGSERYWIGTVVGDAPLERDRDAEFRTHGLDGVTLAAQLDAVLDHSRTILESLTLSELETRRNAPRDDQEYTVAWAILHALEHTALHAGQIQLTHQLWVQGR